ncbi:MAG: diguanylate cyclase, partial [Nitrospiria bacterium]
MGVPLRVLIVEDSEDDAALLLRELRRGGYDVESERVDTAPAMRAALSRPWDLIVSDYTLPHFNGLAALDLWKNAGLDIPFLIVSGSIGEDTAVGAMKAGANDYLMKDNLSRLVPAIQRGLAEARVRQERRRAEETIHRLAYYDVLTKLPNRSLLHDQLKDAIRSGQERHTPVALLLMDLDRFKEVNDTLGHPHGDRLLEQIGPRIQAVLHASETIARLGGDEFAVVVPAADARHAARIAQQILRAIEEPFTIEGLPLAIEASVGIAIAPDHGVDPDRLIQCADVAMYLAKAKRSGHVIYQPDRDQHSPRRLALFGELRHAIDRKQLFLLYQPKIDLQSGRLTGVEALIRWQHPEYGVVPPDEFIPVAERSGLIKPLTLWVLETALAQCRAWREAGLRLSVAV